MFTGIIPEPGDVDRFRFKANQGQVLEAEMRASDLMRDRADKETRLRQALAVAAHARADAAPAPRAAAVARHVGGASVSVVAAVARPPSCRFFASGWRSSSAPIALSNRLPSLCLLARTAVQYPVVDFGALKSASVWTST